MLLRYRKLFENKNDRISSDKMKDFKEMIVAWEKVPKIGDLVVCIGDVDNLKTHNHIGILRDEGIQFINRFSNRLHNLDGDIKDNNGWYLRDHRWTKLFNNNKKGTNIPIQYSDEFIEILSYSLKSLIDYEYIYYSDVSFIEATNRNDTISCLSSTNYYKLEEHEDPWTSTMRQNIRIGRFIKKIITDDSDALIEEAVNEYKFSFNIHRSNLGKFKMAKGIDMARWYLEGNYADGGGSLNASCMRHVRSQRRLGIYTNNPNKVRMLYLQNPGGKLLGRALIWKLDEPRDVVFMDRIYTTEDYIEKLFLDYAKKKKMLTRDEAEKKNILLRVDLNKDYGPPHNNPFMDTFKFFDRDNRYLTNRFKNFKADHYWEYLDHD